MPKLYFKIGSDWEKVVKLREEIAKLQSQLKTIDVNKAPHAAKTLNNQLNQSQKELKGLINVAAKAGVELGDDLKSKIYKSSQAVNDFTQKIIAQKEVVKDVQADVHKLTIAYNRVRRNPLQANGALSELNAARRALDEEKASLFGLQTQQSNARLSVKKLRDEYALYKDESKLVTEANGGMAVSFGKVFGVLGGIALIKQLGSEILHTRAKFESMQVSLETLLGDKAKADELLGEIKNYAKMSPLTLSDIQSATEMMVGFNIEAEKTPVFIRALGDISRGESQKFNSLTLAFSQMSAAGKLMGQDLNQMINAGFNPLQIMAQKTGKSIAKLKDEMSKGAISSEMVQQAFIDATSAGGRFYKMSENASKTINGQLSMMQDALDRVFNQIGTDGEGVIMGAIKGTTSLINNYETVGKVLVGLVTTYGAYRVALAITTLENGKYVISLAKLGTALKSSAVAQALLNSTILKNPYVVAAVLIGTLVTAMIAFHDATTTQEKEVKRVSERTEQYNKYLEDEKNKIDELIAKLQDETATRQDKLEAFKELQQIAPEVFGKYKSEKELIDHLTDALKKQNEQMRIRQNLMSIKNNNDDIARYKELQQFLSLAQKKKSGRTSSEESDFNFLLKKYEVYKRGAGVSVESYIKEMMNSLSSTIGSGQEIVRRQEQTTWEATLDDMSKATAKAQKTMYQGYKILLRQSGKQWIKIEGEDAPIDDKTLTNRISLLNQKVLSVEEKTAQQFRDGAKKAWEDAKKAVEKVKTSSATYKSSDQYEKALKEAKDKEKSTKQNYENLGGVTGSSLSKEENKAAKLKKDTEKYNLLLDKQAREEKRKLEDLQNKIDEGHIKAMDSGSKKTIAEMEQNFEEELQAIDREKEDALQKSIDNARSAFEANPKNKGKTFDASGVTLSDDEIKKFDELYKNSLAKWAKEQSDYNKKSKDAWNAYYKEFGTYAQKRQAIIDSYNEQIEKAGTDGDKAILQKKMQNELDDLDNSVQNSATLMGQLFADASLKSVNEIQKIIDKAELLMQYLEMTKDENGTANVDGKTVTEKDILDLGISKNALDNLEKSPKDVEALRNAIAKFKGEMEKKSPFKLFKGQLKEARDSIKKGGKDNIGQGISEIGSAITSFMPAVSELGQNLGDILGNDKLGNAVSKVTEGLAGAGQAAMGVGQIMSGDVLGGVMSVVSGVSQIATAFKGVSKEQKDTERLESVTENISNVQETINSLIEKRIDLIKEATAAEASYLEATTQTSIDVQKAYYEEQFNRLQGNDILAKEGKHNNLTLKDLGISSLDDLKEFLSSDKLLSYQNNGYGIRDLDKWQDLVKAWQDLQDKEEELEDTTKESFTGISFDDAKDALDDLLTSTDTTEKKIADNFEDYMRTAILNMVKKSYLTDALQQWYSDFAAKSSDGELSQSDVDELRKEYQNTFDEAQKKYKDMLSIAGIDSGSSSSQSSTSKSYESWSQTDADEVSGRFTALQITGEEIKQQNIEQTMSLKDFSDKANQILTVSSDIKNIADDTRNILASTYLETVEIKENTGATVKELKSVNDRLGKIESNTKGLVSR